MQVLRLVYSSWAGTKYVYASEITKGSVKIIDNESHYTVYSRKHGRSSGFSKMSSLSRIGEGHISVEMVEEFLKAIGKDTWNGKFKYRKNSKGVVVNPDVLCYTNKFSNMKEWLIEMGCEIVSCDGTVNGRNTLQK